MYKNPQNPSQSTNVLMTPTTQGDISILRTPRYLLLSYLDLKSMYQSNGVWSGCPVGPQLGNWGSMPMTPAVELCRNLRSVHLRSGGEGHFDTLPIHTHFGAAGKRPARPPRYPTPQALSERCSEHLCPCGKVTLCQVGWPSKAGAKGGLT